MHELGIVSGVLDSVRPVAQEAGASRLLGITLRVGEMTGALQDALQFAWEALCEGDPFLEGAQLSIQTVHPRSRCLECGNEFDHDQFHWACPICGSAMTELLAGRELQIESIEVDIPDGGEGV